MFLSRNDNKNVTITLTMKSNFEIVEILIQSLKVGCLIVMTTFYASLGIISIKFVEILAVLQRAHGQRGIIIFSNIALKKK